MVRDTVIRETRVNLINILTNKPATEPVITT